MPTGFTTPSASTSRANDVFFEAEPSTDYALVGNQIYFFEAGKAATVKATYDVLDKVVVKLNIDNLLIGAVNLC